MQNLWVEKFRPKVVTDYVFTDNNQRQQVEHWVKEKSIPHIMLSGSPGTGKTTLAKVLINELNVDEYDVLQINASRDNGVDFIKNKVEGFVSTMPFGKFKVVLMDECLDQNTGVIVLRTQQEIEIPIKDVNDETDLIKSYNTHTNQIEWKSFSLFNKGEQETIEIEFENNEKVICTLDHKWYVDVDGVPTVVKAKDLHKYMHVLTVQLRVGMVPLNIKSIIPSGVRRVYDISVPDNHNFFITSKQILTHNCDYLSHNAQGIMRGLLETYAEQARFIFTCNYPQKVIPALHSRCQGFHISKTDITEFTARAATILVSENIEFDLETLDSYVKATYPDLRKCLNLLQANSVTGKLIPPGENDKSVLDWRLEAVELFKKKKFKEARTVICNQAGVEDIDSMFRWFYDNLELWSSTEEGQDEAILIIRKGLVNASLVADQEVNLAATLIELTQIEK